MSAVCMLAFSFYIYNGMIFVLVELIACHYSIQLCAVCTFISRHFWRFGSFFITFSLQCCVIHEQVAR